MVEVLRRFSSDVSDVKVKQKQLIFEELKEYIARKGEERFDYAFHILSFADLPDNAIRGITKLLLPPALLRYDEFALHRLVTALLDQMGSNYRGQTIAAVSDVTIATLGNLKASS